MRRPLPICAFLFGIYVVVFPATYNWHLVTARQVVMVLGIMASGIAIFGIVCRLVLGWDWQKSGIVASVAVLVLFPYAYLHAFLEDVTLSGIRVGGHWFLMSGLAALFVLLSVFLGRLQKRHVDAVVQVLNGVSAFLLAILAFSTVVWPMIQGGYSSRATVSIPNGLSELEMLDSRENRPVRRSPPPDIYYIILDGYARADVLKEIYHFDNSPFVEALKARGFYIADQSFANYCQTWLSLSSSLNLDYHFPPKEGGNPPTVHRIGNSLIVAFLKRQGYRIVNIPTSYYSTAIPDADLYLDYRPSLLGALLEMPVFLDTPFGAIIQHLNPRLDDDIIRDRRLQRFEQLEGVEPVNSPSFIFAHFLLPHPPFVFNENGGYIEKPCRPRSIGIADGSHFHEMNPSLRHCYIRNYRQQVAFVNNKVLVVLDAILAKYREPPIIILQADHGPGARLNTRSLADSDPRERMAIFNTYLLPFEGNSDLYSDISPVNTFRIILRRYFGIDIGLLEDRSYFSTWTRSLEFIDVTRKVGLAGSVN